LRTLPINEHIIYTIFFVAATLLLIEATTL